MITKNTLRASLALAFCLASSFGHASGLSDRQKSVLDEALVGERVGKIIVDCDHDSCRDTQRDIAEAFRGANWLVIEPPNDRSITSVSGVRLEYCGIEPVKVRDTLYEMGVKKVDELGFGDCPTSVPQIFLILGRDQ